MPRAPNLARARGTGLYVLALTPLLQLPDDFAGYGRGHYFRHSAFRMASTSSIELASSGLRLPFSAFRACSSVNRFSFGRISF